MEALFTYLVPALTFLSALAAFFYQKDGAINNIKGAGIVLLIFVVSIGALNLYSVYSDDLSRKDATRRIAVLQENERVSQSYLAVQFFQSSTRFTNGNLNFSLEMTDFDVNGEPKHPIADGEYIGILPIRGPAGPVAHFGIDVPIDGDDSSRFMQVYLVERDACGSLTARRISQQSQYQTASRLLYLADGCPSPSVSGNETGSEDRTSPFSFFWEVLNAEHTFGIFLDSKLPSLAVASNILEKHTIAEIKIYEVASNSDYLAMISRDLKVNIRFYQKYKDHMDKYCNRIMYVNLIPDERRIRISNRDIEIQYVVDGPIKAYPCKISEI